MLCAVKGIPLELHFLGYSDIPSHHRLTPGKKTVPILQQRDGTFVTESKEILKYFDHLAEFGPPMIASYESRDLELAEFFSPEHLFKGAFGKLVLPRVARCPLLELSSADDRQYFEEKKEAMSGDFDGNVFNSDELIGEVQRDFLERTLSIIKANVLEDPQHRLSFDDLLIWPMLRLLSVVKNVQWPPELHQYVSRWAHTTSIELFYNVAS